MDKASCSLKLLEAFTASGVITSTNALMIDQFMAIWSVGAYDALLATGLLTEEELADALAASLNLPRFVDFAGAQLHLPALPVVTFGRARAWECLPLTNAEGGLSVVFVDAGREDRIDEIKQGLNSEFSLLVGALSDTLKWIDELYPLAAQLPSLYGR